MVLHTQKIASKKVISIRPDNAKELTKGLAKEFLDDNGTVIDPILPYSPQFNGRAESASRAVLEKALTILSKLNMHTKDMRKKTSYEILTGNKLDLSHIRIFGSKVKVLKPKKYCDGKVNAKTWDGLHAGCAPGGAYRRYISELKRVFFSKDTTFIEKIYRDSSSVTFEIGNDSDSSEKERDSDDEYIDAYEAGNGGGTVNVYDDDPWKAIRKDMLCVTKRVSSGKDSHRIETGLSEDGLSSRRFGGGNLHRNLSLPEKVIATLKKTEG
eukprot:IDg12290t1